MRTLPLASSLLLLLVACGGGEAGGSSDVPAPPVDSPPPAVEPVANGDFALGAAAPVRMRRGETKTLAIAITRTAGAVGPVHLSITGLPAGIHASEAIANDGEMQAELELTADASVAPATLPLVIRGALGTTEHTQTSSLLVTGLPGELDTTFGASGRADVEGAGWVAELAALADGRVLAGANVGGEALVARFTSAGQLDTSFGEQGLARVPHPAGFSDELRRILVLSDGRIVISGERRETAINKDRGLAARFDANGHLDTSFAQSGVAAIASGGDDTSFGAGIIENADGTLFFGGYDVVASKCGVLVTKLDATGAPDVVFGPGGSRIVKAPAAPDTDLCPTTSVKLPGGGFVLGATAYASVKMAAIRFDAKGDLDTTFGTSGFTLMGSEPAGAWISSLALAPDGKLVVGGYSRGPADSEMTFARLDTSGKLDATFGNGGLRTIDVGPLRSEVYTVKVAPDGTIAAAGWVEITQNVTRFAMVRLDATGSVDKTFGTNGTVTGLDSIGAGYAIAFGSDGRLLLGTHFTDTKRPGLARFWN